MHSVLIVEDEKHLAAGLCYNLKAEGFDVEAVGTGEEALALLNDDRKAFDVMVLDASLGSIGALELLRRLRGHSDRAAANERTDIPIVMIAASTSELDPMLAKRYGADGVILAPIELERLATDLTRVLTAWRASHPGRQWADEAALGTR